MSVSKAYIQLGYFIYTAIDGLKQRDYWRRRDGDISNNGVCTTFVKGFYGDGDPQLWARQPYTAFMLVSEAQTYPERNWAPWFNRRSSASCNCPFFVYPKCINLFCIICVGLMPHPGNWRKDEQNPEYEQGADEKRYLYLLKWQVSISLGRTSHSISLAFFHFQCSVLHSLLQHSLGKHYGLIISPTLMISFCFQLNKEHCYINMSYFSSGEFVHLFSLQESIQTYIVVLPWGR